MKEIEEMENPITETYRSSAETVYSSCAEGFIWNGWRYFRLGVDNYEQLYY